ncbi:hypothetical protein E1573_19125 [Pseudomonas sp. H9]|nr:hypothetical protein E1573_19125 [Pseudomonas sp. H9]
MVAVKWVICFAAYQTGNVVMREGLEKFREWLTPRRRLWAGTGLFATVLVVPLISPGTSVSFLVGPASVLFFNAFMPAYTKR